MVKINKKLLLCLLMGALNGSAPQSENECRVIPPPQEPVRLSRVVDLVAQSLPLQDRLTMESCNKSTNKEEGKLLNSLKRKLPTYLDKLAEQQYIKFLTITKKHSFTPQNFIQYIEDKAQKAGVSFEQYFFIILINEKLQEILLSIKSTSSSPASLIPLRIEAPNPNVIERAKELIESFQKLPKDILPDPFALKEWFYLIRSENNQIIRKLELNIMFHVYSYHLEQTNQRGEPIKKLSIIYHQRALDREDRPEIILSYEDNQISGGFKMQLPGELLDFEPSVKQSFFPHWAADW